MMWNIWHFIAGPVLLLIVSFIRKLPKMWALIALVMLIAIVFEAGQWDMFATFKSWEKAIQFLTKDTLCDLSLTAIGLGLTLVIFKVFK